MHGDDLGGKMDATALELFRELTTPHVADACLRTGVEVRCAPSDVRALSPAYRLVGKVRPVRHYGSVDIFLEALEHATPGEVLVIDNSGRRDEACVGDLIVLETKLAGLAGIVIWGLHRDTQELHEIGLPIFSLGDSPTGPLRLDPREAAALASARVGAWTVGADDVAMADANGVLFLPAARAEEIAALAAAIRDAEREQAQKMRRGTSLRAQLRFADFLAGRSSNPTRTFREHLRRIGGAIEE
jgi:4-hydroxy-4-methyl-2-oxoglutarate aldolase